MKLKSVIFSALAAIAMLAGCQKENDNLGGMPTIVISETEMAFGVESGEKTLTVKANRDWKVEYEADWIEVSPKSGKASATPQTVTVTVLANDGAGAYDRSEDVKFTIGMDDEYLTVTQTGAAGSAEALIAYENDFDKEVANKSYGSSGSSWPYCDQFDGWKNEKGSGAASVVYKFKSASPRASSNNNNIWLPKTGGYLSIQDIALNGKTTFQLSFGTICGSTGTYKKEFDKNILKVYLSADKAKWVDLNYTHTVNAEGFDSAEATFTVPSGTESLSITFEKVADEVDGYRIDDVKLVVSEETGATAIDFTTGVDKTFNDGGSSSDGGNTGGNTGGGTDTAPEGAIFFESFSAGMGSFTLDEKVVPPALKAVWEYSSQYKCMKATAYVNPTNYASESWLISPEIDLAGQTAAYLTFEHAGGYFGTASNEATLWISKDGGAWAQLTIDSAAYPTSWSFISAGVWDLKDYLGSKIKIAFKYLSTDTKAGTWEVRNVSVIAGTYQAEPEPEAPVVPDGTTVTVTTNSTDMTWAADTHATYGAGFAASADGLKVAYYKHTSGSTPVEAKADHIRVYKSSVLVLTLDSGADFKYIKLTTTGGDHCNTYTVPSGETVVVGNDVIWTGKQASPFVGEMSVSQLRIKSITVVY